MGGGGEVMRRILKEEKKQVNAGLSSIQGQTHETPIIIAMR